MTPVITLLLSNLFLNLSAFHLHADPRAWMRTMRDHALRGHDARADLPDTAPRFRHRRVRPLFVYPEVDLIEVGLAHTAAEAENLESLSMEPLAHLARGRDPAFVGELLELIEALDTETYELMRGSGGKLVKEHLYVHPLTLRLLQWLATAGGEALARPDVYYAQACAVVRTLLENSTAVVFHGTRWTVLDSGLRLRGEILKRYGGSPGLGSHSLDRDDLTREFSLLESAVLSELVDLSRRHLGLPARCAPDLTRMDESATIREPAP